ncbi:hypothetical protein BDM02DRAFT_3109648 [Thelephora ganbajun]|uniref:Uncharacterized protein n=1 Tax=Thelephora ganbajun TaxID=370292 RepID=A0ACB6ZRY6_THEGA|nr:hypothetical protein BDM02DRAFT_3109648 [Thelephora ganbajun]
MSSIREIFPTSVLWNKIVRQCARSPVEEVTFEMISAQDSVEDPIEDPIIRCLLTFQSSDMGVIRSDFNVLNEDEDELQMPLEDMGYSIFLQASRTIWNHPLVSNIKRLHIKHGAAISSYSAQKKLMMNKVGKLFKSMGSLDELTIHGCDLRIFLAPFFDIPELDDIKQSFVFPPIKELTISHPSIEEDEEGWMDGEDEEGWMDGVLEFAKSQHALGVPFERVTVRAEKLPTTMVERLRSWVGVVECYEECRMEDNYV